MFTIQQITQVHARVASGADFPQYVQNLRQLGVEAYDHYVADGHNLYFGAGQVLPTGPTGAPLTVAAHGNKQALQHALTLHQHGQTDYPTFCQQAAAAGVEKWTTNTRTLTCTYYDQQGQVLVEEAVPVPETGSHS